MKLSNLIIVLALGFQSCKSTNLQSLEQSAPKTHSLAITFDENLGQVKYEITGANKETGTVKSVKLRQLSFEESLEWPKDKIDSDLLALVNTEKEYFPTYHLELKTDTLSCVSLSIAYIGAKSVNLNCQKLDAKTSGQMANIPPPTNRSWVVPSNAPSCTGAKIRAYQVCRYFEGGAFGCYNKSLKCIVPMTPEQCKITKDNLSREYAKLPFISRWDCSSGVTNK
jgi:hypothetical protein